MRTKNPSNARGGSPDAPKDEYWEVRARLTGRREAANEAATNGQCSGEDGWVAAHRLDPRECREGERRRWRVHVLFFLPRRDVWMRRRRGAAAWGECVSTTGPTFRRRTHIPGRAAAV